MKFRKKPVVIEAAKFDGELVGMHDPTFDKVIPRTCPAWFPAVIEEFPTDAIARAAANNYGAGQVTKCGDLLYIGTLEGVMCAAPGDWIIQGVKGEIYPCKPDIFAQTYERA